MLPEASSSALTRMPPARERSASRRSAASASGDREAGPTSSAGAAASSSADALGGRVDDPSRTRAACKLGGVVAEATRDGTSGRERLAMPARIAGGGRTGVAIVSAARRDLATRGWRRPLLNGRLGRIIKSAIVSNTWRGVPGPSLFRGVTSARAAFRARARRDPRHGRWAARRRDRRPPPARWAPRALGTWRRADPRRTSRGTVDVASRRVAFPSAALVDARRARRDRDARVAARSADGGASSRDSPTTTSDADACVFERGDVALLPNGARMRFVSRPDVQFLYDEIFVDECYAKHGLEIREGATVIDVGGNIGMFALYAARKAGVSGRVFALEPIPRTFAALRENVTNNVSSGFFLPLQKSGADDGCRVACLDAKDAAAALRAVPRTTRARTNDDDEEGSSAKVSSDGKGHFVNENVVAYNVGVSDGVANAATFTFYPRAAGWSSLAPDDAETRANVARFAAARLALRGDGDGDGDGGLLNRDAKSPRRRRTPPPRRCTLWRRSARSCWRSPKAATTIRRRRRRRVSETKKKKNRRRLLATRFGARRARRRASFFFARRLPRDRVPARREDRSRVSAGDGVGRDTSQRALARRRRLHALRRRFP